MSFNHVRLLDKAVPTPLYQSTAYDTQLTAVISFTVKLVAVTGSVSAVVAMQGSNDVQPNGAILAAQGAPLSAEQWQPAADSWVPMYDQGTLLSQPITTNGIVAVGSGPSGNLFRWVRATLTFVTGAGGTVTIDRFARNLGD